MTVLDWAILIFFRLLNFALVIGLGWYVFKKYLYTPVTEQMDEQEKKHTDLLNKKNDTNTEEKDLQKTMQDEVLLCKKLKEKVIIWQTATDQSLHERQKEKQEIIQHITQQMKKQIENVTKQKSFMQIVPQAIEGAQQELEKKCTAHEIQSFNNKIIDFMKKSTQ